MRIHKEGKASIIIVLLLIIILSYNTFLMFPEEYWKYSLILYFIYFGFWVFIISFFRYPKRTVNIQDNKIIAPADGTIVVVEEITENEYFNDKRQQVSIFMSPLNVHANWYPLSGVVSYVKYHAGRHLVAHNPKSSTDNERTTVVVKHKNGEEVMFRQVAGAVARRIVCYSKEGDKVNQGDNFGFIKFGSRVDIILPLSAKINVKLDDKPVAQNTVIAEF
jgi:phosphatidylserine decarboxylase